MTNVVLSAGKKCKHTFFHLTSVLSDYFSLCVLDGQSLLQGEPPYDFFIYQCEQLQHLHGQPTVLLVQEAQCLSPRLEVGEPVVAVVLSDNGRDMELLSHSKIKGITCGFSTRDTLTVSSITTESAVICLQRTLTTFSGATVEPVELPVTLSRPMDMFSLLCVAAVLLLSDQVQVLLNGRL